jgi:hypothetical protein
MTTELRMTRQAGTTAATVAPPAIGIRKATKDPADQAADQFAAMFAALCLLPLPQPQATRAANHEEAAPATMANSEIAGSDSAWESSTPVITLQALAPETAMKGASLSTNVELVPAPVWSQIPAASAASPQSTALPPAARTQEASAADDIDNPEIAGSYKIPSSLTPGNGRIAPETAMKGASLSTNVELAPAPVWSQIPALSALPEGVVETQEATAADGMANPEISRSDRIPTLLTPVINARTMWAPPTLLSSKPGFEGLSVRPQTEFTSVTANAELAPAPAWQPPIPTASSSQRPEIESPYAIAQTAQAIPLSSGLVLPPAIGRTANTLLVDPIPVAPHLQVADESKLAEPPVAPQAQVAVEGRIADQTPQTNAVRRPSSLVAGLATPTLNEGQGNTAVSGKSPLAGNGFDLRGNDTERDADFVPQSRLPGLSGEVSFATTVRDLQSGGGASSIQSQTISQIIAQAENLPGRQMRSFRLRLRPEELGEIDIQLSRDAAGRISAHISAKHESARATLSRSLDELRATLSRAGLSVDKLQISTEPGLSAGNRGTEDARSNTRESPSGVANLLTENETEAGGQPRATDEKLLSLHA